MKRLDKCVAILLIIPALALSVCLLAMFCPIPYLHVAVRTHQTAYLWLDYALCGFGVFLCLLFSLSGLVILFSPNATHTLMINKARGRLSFSKRTVESAVRYSFADIGSVTDAKVKATLRRKPEKTRVYVRLTLDDLTALAQITETIQEKIETGLLASLGTTVKSISVTVDESPKRTKTVNDTDTTVRVIG